MSRLIRFFQFSTVSFFLVGCVSQPQIEAVNREPQARDDGSMKLEKRVLYHSRQFEGYEVWSKIIDSFRGKKLVMFGEIHGTKEMPEYTGAVIKAAAQKFQNVYVGIEFPVDMQKPVEKFLATGDTRVLKDTKFFSDPNFHSGRGTDSVVKMLEDIRKIDNVRVFCFDTSNKKETRDTAMARQVLSTIEKVNSPTSETSVAAAKEIEAMVPVRLRKIHQPLVILLTGNIHSRLEPGIPGGNENAPTMGSELIRLSEDKKSAREPLTTDNILSVLFRYERGAAWNCVGGEGGRIDCGNRVLQSPPSIYSTSNESQRYYMRELELTDGHNATVFFREVNAAQPLR